MDRGHRGLHSQLVHSYAVRWHEWSGGRHPDLAEVNIARERSARCSNAALLIAAMAVPSSLAAQTVQGFVADGATSELIPAATIVLVQTGEETVSGPDGSFSFSDAPEGPISVRVRA